MKDNIIPFPAPVIRISKDLDDLYPNDKDFIRGVVRNLYGHYRTVSVAAGEDAAVAAVESDMSFYEAMDAARKEIERMEAFYKEHHADKERK